MFKVKLFNHSKINLLDILQESKGYMTVCKGMQRLVSWTISRHDPCISGAMTIFNNHSILITKVQPGVSLTKFRP